MEKEQIMQLCAEHAANTMRADLGGPFGAAVTRNGEIISLASNSVLSSKDPTAHAEVNAIREACRKLGTIDLSDCELYATGFPCPMCLSAIMWANIKKIYVSGKPEDAAEIGFRDDFMYDYINAGMNDQNTLEIDYVDRSIAGRLYADYRDLKKEIY